MRAKRKQSPVKRSAGAKVVELFGADLRSLAAFRIVLAILVLADLVNRATDLSAHYTDDGVLPRSVLEDEVLSRWALSLHLINGTPLFQALLFGIATLAALGLLVGYRTRLMTVITWVLLLSIQWRNPLVLAGGDILLRMLLFWSMFLPLGAYWSLDRARKVPAPQLSMRILSVATVGLFLQIAFMYWFTAILKSGPEWRLDGTAIYYALSIDQLTTPVGAYLYQFPGLLKLLTFATLGLEALGPFLLFSPFFTGPVRTGAILAFMSLHFGIWLTMDIDMFPWIGAFCMVCFLPTWFWSKFGIERRLYDIGNRSTFQPYWARLRAQLATLLGVSYPSIATDGGKIRPAAAQGASKRKAQHATSAEGKPIMLRSSLATNLLAFLFLLYIFFWNITTVTALKMPQSLVPLSSSLGLEQSWGMFAPSPATEDGWFVIPATLQGGQQVELMGVIHNDFSLRQVSWEKPEYVPSTFKNEHWRKYLERIWSKEYAGQRVHFGRYICREWNARHTGTDRLTTFQIIYMLETTLPDYQNSTPQKVAIWEHEC